MYGLYFNYINVFKSILKKKLYSTQVSNTFIFIFNLIMVEYIFYTIFFETNSIFMLIFIATLFITYFKNAF